MDRAEIVSMLKSVGINVVYGWYEQGQEPHLPYCVIDYLESNDISGDNCNYVHRDRWQVDLVTAKRDEALERRIELALSNRGLFYSKTQTVDSADRYAVMHYRFTTIGG